MLSLFISQSVENSIFQTKTEFSQLPNTFKMMSELDGFVQNPIPNSITNPNPIPLKRKRNLPGTPDPDAEVISLSPKSLMATNRFLCEVCNKGFQRDQNLQLHRRGHNLPWKLKQRTNIEGIRKKVYVCPEKTCVHNDPSRALGDLTGIKKHYSRKHGEKKWKCEKCSKKYAVQSDWKAHSKICGTKEYKCDCGTLFSRKDSFITHRAFCDALTDESGRFNSVSTFRNNLVNAPISKPNQGPQIPQFPPSFQPQFCVSPSDGQKPISLPLWIDSSNSVPISTNSSMGFPELTQPNSIPPYGSTSITQQWLRGLKEEEENKGSISETINSLFSSHPNTQQINPPHASATALLQKAAQMGSTSTNSAFNSNVFGLINSALSNVSSQSPNSSYNLTKIEETDESFTHLASSTPGRISGDGSLLDDLSYSNSFMGSNDNFEPMMISSSFKECTQNVRRNAPMSSNELCEQSLTRDFLGVGRESITPFLQHKTNKCSAVSRARDLNQYSGNHE